MILRLFIFPTGKLSLRACAGQVVPLEVVPLPCAGQCVRGQRPGGEVCYFTKLAPKIHVQMPLDAYFQQHAKLPKTCLFAQNLPIKGVTLYR